MAGEVPSPENFHIAWLCVINVERIAAWYALEERYKCSSKAYKTQYQLEGDDNEYLFGSINSYNVVIACFSGDGAVKAGYGLTHLARSFNQIKYYLLVGV